MKKLILSLVFLAGAWTAAAQHVELRAAPSETVELMYVMMSLAGDSYDRKMSHVSPEYRTQIRSRFKKYRRHSAIMFIKKELIGNGNSMKMYSTKYEIGINSEIIDGRFVYFGAGKGWSDETRNRLEEEVDKFYHDTDFHTFWLSAHNEYAAIGKVFRNTILPNVNIEWLMKGSVPAGDTLTLDLTISRLEFDSVLRGSVTNDLPHLVVGIPHSKLELLLRENIHTIYSYVTDIMSGYRFSLADPLLRKYYPETEEAGGIILSRTKPTDELYRTDFWLPVFDFSFTEASLIAFMPSNDRFEPFRNNLIAISKNHGYYWIEDLVALLLEYEAAPDRYPTLDSFMPRIVDFYNELALKPEY